ncbi:MAG: NAD(P)H-dependent glycerol-3-phosphate dehydrogenase [Candidatus Kapaibacterium sp.]
MHNDFNINKQEKISVVGAGGWGTAVALVLADSGFENIKMWAHEPAVVEEINSLRSNEIFLAGAKIPQQITATADPAELEDSRIIFMAVPTQYIREVVRLFGDSLKNQFIVNLSKGIERKSLMRISELLGESAGIPPSNYCVLSGPSHAEEVVRRMPTTVVAASDNKDFARAVQSLFTANYFRVYSSEDVTGCEFGGSLKNVIAIAAGMIDGIGLGDNTKAALITRGLAEITRLGTKLGADSFTFSGLSGLGDLLVTANSRHSRNRYVGEQIGRGKSLNAVSGKMQMVAEGVHTTESAYQLGRKAGVELPITEQLYRILFEGVDPVEALDELMTRSNKREWW